MLKKSSLVSRSAILNYGSAANPDPRLKVHSRGTLILVCLMIFSAVLGYYARGWTLTVVSLLFTESLITTLWMLAAGLLGACVLRRLKLGDVSPALMITTAVGLGLGFLSLATLGLGLAGVLNRA